MSSHLRALLQRCVHKLFDIRPALLESPQRLAACKQYILAVHPHGVLSLGHILTILGDDEKLDNALPQAQRSALSAGILFKIPCLREQCLWTGAVDAGRRTASRCLDAGLSLSVVPGGEREQLLAQRGAVERLVLRRRQGFIRLALMHGVPVVPVYCFGETQLYRQSGFLMGLRSWLQRTLGMALVMPYGPWGLPGWPFRAPFRMVVGVPMEMPKLPLPTQQEVDEHHQRYMAEVINLFERNKAACGYGDISLELI